MKKLNSLIAFLAFFMLLSATPPKPIALSREAKQESEYCYVTATGTINENTYAVFSNVFTVPYGTYDNGIKNQFREMVEAYFGKNSYLLNDYIVYRSNNNDDALKSRIKNIGYYKSKPYNVEYSVKYISDFWYNAN